MKHFFTLVLACFVIASAAFAQNLENFTALTGAKAAREKVAQMGYSDAKLIIISSHGNNNRRDSTNWEYTFSYVSDSKILELLLTKANGVITSSVQFDDGTENYRSYSHNRAVLSDFIDIPDTIIDSDFPFIKMEKYASSTSISSKTNVDFGGMSSMDSIGTFVYRFDFVSSESDTTIGDKFQGAIQFYSAETGSFIGEVVFVGVEETSPSSTFTLSPNPTTGNISINGTTTSPQMPIHVRIIDALGRQQYQEYTQARPDGTFTFLWDGNAGGESLPTGAYSAVMTVGSVVKSVPFVVVR